MPRIPKRVKFRNMHGGRTTGRAQSGNKLSFGEYGLLALKPGYFTERQIEAARVAVTHHLKGKGKLWVRIFPDRPITSKPAETRMGKGKGDLSQWTARILPGRMILELTGIGPEEAKEALRLASGKFPLSTRIITR
jgi:large subunit ribosomal protein L16